MQRLPSHRIQRAYEVGEIGLEEDPASSGLGSRNEAALGARPDLLGMHAEERGGFLEIQRPNRRGRQRGRNAPGKTRRARPLLGRGILRTHKRPATCGSGRLGSSCHVWRYLGLTCRANVERFRSKCSETRGRRRILVGDRPESGRSRRARLLTLPARSCRCRRPLAFPHSGQSVSAQRKAAGAPSKESSSSICRWRRAACHLLWRLIATPMAKTAPQNMSRGNLAYGRSGTREARNTSMPPIRGATNSNQESLSRFLRRTSSLRWNSNSDAPALSEDGARAAACLRS